MGSKKALDRPERFERLDLILDILRNGDHLETGVISERLASRIKENAEDPSFRRSVHRDLQELNRRDKVNVDFYDRNGQLLDDYDSSDTKSKKRNLVCKWFISSGAEEYQGKKLIESKQVTFWIPESQCEGVKVSIGDSNSAEGSKGIYFLVANQYLRVEIQSNLLPFNLLISRQTNEIRQSEKDYISKQSNSEFFGILKIPYPELSAYRNQEKPGHAILKIVDKNKIQIQDFGSSNGSFAFPSPLTPEQVKKTIESHNMTKTLRKMDNYPGNPEKIENIKQATLPALLELGVNLFLIV